MSNSTLVNFVAGETSPKSRGRFDIPSFTASCRKLVNFICEVAGPARFRSGFSTARETRGSAVARLIPFQLNDSQAYMLEFTAAKMRVYKDGELQTVARTTITAATQANPCVITVASTTGLANGDEVIITGCVGMIELNGRQVKLAGSSGSTFQLVDPTTGVNIISTAWGQWTSGGTLVEIYEIASPYLAGELDDIQFAQNRNTMYLTHYLYAPRKLTVDSAEAWSLGTYSRTNDPFVSSSPVLTVDGAITLGTTTYVYFAVGSVIEDGAVYAFAAVGGTTQLNGNSYRLEVSGYYNTGGPYYPRAILRNATTGALIDSTAWTPWTSGGTATPAADNPIGVAFYESRLWFLGTDQRPNTVFGSMAPTDAGANRFDTFTGGTGADDAVFFSLAPTSGRVDYISWGLGTSKSLLVGTFGGPFRISGGGTDEPITPSNVNVRQIDGFGCEGTVPAMGQRAMFIQRGGTTLRAVRYNADLEDYESADMTLNADHISNSGMTRVVIQAGAPDLVWVLREDGILAGMTIQGNENIAGWHRQKIGGTDAKIIDVAVLPRPNANDQLWIVAERTINGATRRTVEIMADEPTFFDHEDFFTDLDTEAADTAAFEGANYRRQGDYIHMDGAHTYDGSDRGVTAGATLTSGVVTVDALSRAAIVGDTGVTFTASAAVFVVGDIGNEIWKKPDADTGLGSGRALITGFTSSTVVTATILVAFDAATAGVTGSPQAIAAGEWYIAAETVTGLWPLEGEEVAVLTDGAVYSDGRGDSAEYTVVTVAEGKITLTDPAAVVHIGIPYDGIIQTQNLEMGGRSGPAQAKPRNISEMFIRFLNTLGVDYGTDLYHLDEVPHRAGGDVADRPTPIFSGIKKLHNSDRWSAEGEKRVVISQRLPLPATVQFIDVHYDTADEG